MMSRTKCLAWLSCLSKKCFQSESEGYIQIWKTLLSIHRCVYKNSSDDFCGETCSAWFERIRPEICSEACQKNKVVSEVQKNVREVCLCCVGTVSQHLLFDVNFCPFC